VTVAACNDTIVADKTYLNGKEVSMSEIGMLDLSAIKRIDRQKENGKMCLRVYTE
jgi:hypothetical protein